MTPAAYRTDCAVRLKNILQDMGDTSEKSMIDIGCANGYFMHGFLSSGGYKAIGIEPSDQEAALAKAYDLLVFPEMTKDIDKTHFDFGLYLDLHFHSQDYLPWLKDHCNILYASTSGEGEKNNMKMAEELMKYYKNVRCLYKTDYANRMIFRCV